MILEPFSRSQGTDFVSHGCGHMMPLTTGEPTTSGLKEPLVDWDESRLKLSDIPGVSTSSLGSERPVIEPSVLSGYIDRHLDSNFEDFLNNHYESTPFTVRLLRASYHFYLESNSPAVREALKLVIAYDLTLHKPLVEQLHSSQRTAGGVLDSPSRNYDKTRTSIKLDHEINVALDQEWRRLHEILLQNLDSLYASVYSRDKLKNYPIILLLSLIVLTIWENYQVDTFCSVVKPSVVPLSHLAALMYSQDRAKAQYLRTEMEFTSMPLILGLFCAVSQKLPPFTEWETGKHHNLLGSNMYTCNLMTAIRALIQANCMCFHFVWTRSCSLTGTSRKSRWPEGSAA